MPVANLVADANVLLSAILGKAANRVFTVHRLTVHVTEYNLDEVDRYLPRLAERFRMPIDLLRIQRLALPVHAHPFPFYQEAFADASRRLSARDPHDAHPLALAVTMGLPLWSNDRDLTSTDHPSFPTAILLKMLDG